MFAPNYFMIGIENGMGGPDHRICFYLTALTVAPLGHPHAGGGIALSLSLRSF